MIEFLSLAALLFASISIVFAVISGIAVLLSLFIDMLQEKFGDGVAFWVSAVLFVAFLCAFIAGLILLGEGSGA